jgi:hypothetical protein
MMAQAAACYGVSQAHLDGPVPTTLRLAQLRDVEFAPLPPPPFTINITVQHAMDFGGLSLCVGSASINGQIVCTGKLYLSHGKLNA